MPSTQQRAGAANAVFAAEMRAGQIELIAQEIREVRARVDRLVDRTAVDGETDRGHAAASAIARRRMVTWICRSAGVRDACLRQKRVSRARATNSLL